MSQSPSAAKSSDSDASQIFHPLQKKMDWNSVLMAALAEGGDWCDIFWERTSSNKCLLHDRALRDLSSRHDEGLSLRVIIEGRAVLAYTNILTPENILKTARELAAGVRQGAKASFNSPVISKSVHPAWYSEISEKISDGNLAEKLALMREIEAPCWNDSLGIKHVKVLFNDSKRNTFVIRSDGRSVFDEQNIVMIYAHLYGQGPEGGMQHANNRLGGFWDWKKLKNSDPTHLATDTQRLLKVLYKAKPAPSGAMTVVLAGKAGGVMCHEAVGHGLEADYAAEGLSAYSGKLGKQVASAKITVVDDGAVPYARGTQAFDDEGNSTQKTTLIENGILKSYMIDQRMALKTGHHSTGNGRRESYRFPPLCRMTNTYIAAGTDDPEKIVRDTRTGLFVTDMGGGQVDSTSGDFVFEVKESYLIRNGEICEAVRGATLTGNGPQVLQEVDRVGNDVGYDIGTCGKSGQWVPVTDGQPTLRIPHLAVGGSAAMKDYF